MSDEKPENSSEQARQSEPTQPEHEAQDVQDDAHEDASRMASDALSAAQDAVNELQGASTESEQADADTATATADSPDGPNVDLPNFQQVLADVEAGGIDLLHDVDLHVKIELGRTHMLVEDVLRLTEGSVVELDKLAGDPVDVYVNDRLVARGEVLVLNDNFCVRVNEIVSTLDESGEENDNESAPAQNASRQADEKPAE